MRVRGVVGIAVVVLPLIAGVGVPNAAAVDCGWWRVPEKTLTGRGSRGVDYHARTRTVGALLRLHRPDGIGSDTPRLAPGERRTYRIKARMVHAKLMVDHDVRVALASRTHPRRTLVVELPGARCVADSPKRGRMTKARRDLLRACGSLSASHFTKLRGDVVVTGVGFWSELAPEDPYTARNAFELHPVLRFKGRCSQR